MIYEEYGIQIAILIMVSYVSYMVGKIHGINKTWKKTIDEIIGKK